MDATGYIFDPVIIFAGENTLRWQVANNVDGCLALFNQSAYQTERTYFISTHFLNNQVRYRLPVDQRECTLLRVQDRASSHWTDLTEATCKALGMWLDVVENTGHGQTLDVSF